MNVPDNYDQFEARERRQQKWLDSLPKCGSCGKPIQDDYQWNIYGFVYCEKCAIHIFRTEVEV